VAGGRIVPELWQNDVTPENISTLLARFVTENSLQSGVKERLSDAKQRLGGTGASRRAASIAVDMIENKSSM
jgi:lipid-A-disaccharide synthase